MNHPFILVKVCSASDIQASRSEKLSQPRYYVRVTESKRRLDVRTEMQPGETPIWDQQYVLLPVPFQGPVVDSLRASPTEKEFLVGMAWYDLRQVLNLGQGEQEETDLQVVGSNEKVTGSIKVIFTLDEDP